MTKHWIATNFYGLSFATNGVKMFALPSFKTGAILLSGLFFYDVFWVFGTDVMVTVVGELTSSSPTSVQTASFLCTGESSC
jgi:hypothetical protein